MNNKDLSITDDNESLINNQNDENKRERKRCKQIFMLILLFIGDFISLIGLLELFAIFYFAFCGVTSLTINIFIYSWLSLFTKKTIHLVLSIFACLSDFGLLFISFIFVCVSVKLYFSLLPKIFIFVLNSIKLFCCNPNDIPKFTLFNIKSELISVLLMIILNCGVIVLLFFVLFKWLFYVAAFYEITILILVLSVESRILKQKSMINVNGIADSTNLSNNEDTSSNDIENMSDNDNNEYQNNNSSINMANIIIEKVNTTISIYNLKVQNIVSEIENANERINNINMALQNTSFKSSIKAIRYGKLDISSEINADATDLNKINIINNTLNKIMDKIINEFRHNFKKMTTYLNYFEMGNYNYDEYKFFKKKMHFDSNISENIQPFIEEISCIAEKIAFMIATDINKKEDEDKNDIITSENELISHIPSCDGYPSKKLLF